MSPPASTPDDSALRPETRASRAAVVWAVLCTAVLALVWVRTAWTTDDAFVTFRSVEQLLDGNGPRWNPHERVQAFTHPLFFAAVAAGRLVFAEPAASAAALSFFLTLGLFLVLGRHLRWRPERLTLALLVLLASRAFVDYSSGGLEDPLSHFLLVVFALPLLHRGPQADLALLHRSAWLGGLVGLCRHDLALVVAPPLLWLAWRVVRRETASWRAAAGRLALGFSPFLAWTAFAIVYYGFPFPNTAYAKLNTGIESWVLWRHGVDYLVNALRWDPATPVVMLFGALFLWRRGRGAGRTLAFGILLYVLYVLRIGGDFMAGRFWSEPFVVAAAGLVVFLPRHVLRPAMAALAVYLLAWPLSPVHVARGDHYSSYEPDDPREHGIADERAFYTGRRSFDAFERRWPVAVWTARPDPQEHFEVGFSAYVLGLDRVVVDRFGLADPLLARLPVDEGWERIGHFRRPVPEGYLESLRTGENRIENPHIRELYGKIRRVTRGPLFTAERWRAILELNLSYRRPGCADPPCRELVMHRLPPPLFAPILPTGGGEVRSMEVTGDAVKLRGRLPFGDLERGQLVRVFTPVHPEESELLSDGPSFEVRLRFADEATARRAVAVTCVAATAGDRPWRLLDSPNGACRGLATSGDGS